MIPNIKTWYAIYTKSRNEKKVSSLLAEQDIEHYLPLVKKIRQWSDRRKTVEEPLFSSYIFVHITEKEHLPVCKRREWLSSFPLNAGKSLYVMSR